MRKNKVQKLITRMTKEQNKTNRLQDQKVAKHKRKQLAELKAAAAAVTPKHDPGIDNSLARENLKRLAEFDKLPAYKKREARRNPSFPKWRHS